MNTLDRILERPIKAVNSPTKSVGNDNSGTGQVRSFQDFMQERIKQTEVTDGIKFSAHAQARLQSRGIELNSEDLNRINNAVNKAKQKGSKDSLVMLNDLAMIVNIKNRTVITAINGAATKDNVFTNIDSAVMA